MKLNRLTLKNFKGVESLELIPGGKDVVVFGANGTGKSTIADAYAWVTFGKSFSGESIESEIKRKDTATGITPNDGGVIHAVEAEFSLDSGCTVSIRKEYVEKWEKKRGAAESEFRGHTTNYFVNETPMQKKEYEKKVAEFIPETAGRLLSLPLYFCMNLKWQERRKILMDMCGNVSDDTIFENPAIAPLKKLMEGKTIDEYRKTLKAKMKKTNDELKSIPARVDELTIVEDAEGAGEKEILLKELDALNNKRKEAAEKCLRLENGGESAEIKKEIAQIEARMTKFEAEIEATYIKKKCTSESIINGCISEIERLGIELESVQKKCEQLEKINETTDKQAQVLRDTWNAENDKQPNTDISDICPCCGQKLPPEKLEEAKNKVIAQFNLKKSGILAEITAKGKRMMEQKAKNIEEINAGKARMGQIMTRIEELAASKKDAEMSLHEAKPEAGSFDAYREMEAEKNAAIFKIRTIANGDETEIKEARMYVTSIDTEITLINEKLAAIQQTESVKKRKKELMEREKKLGEIYNELEMELNMTDDFIRTKVKLTEDMINRHFKHVRFTMFRKQINGGLEECCEPTIDGVPFGGGLNTGSEMKAALDILNALSKYFGVTLPVFIDNCESYTSDSMIKIENQLIRLVVREGQKDLHIEIDGQEPEEIRAIKAA